MEEIREETIVKAIQEIAAMKPEEFDGLVKKIEEEQPDLMNYLKEIDDEIDYDDWGFMFYNSILIWFSFAQGEKTIGLVSREMIEEGFEANFQLMEELRQSEDLGSAIEELFKHYPQRFLLNYVANALVSDPIIQEKNKLSIFVYLKTLIDLFDQSEGEIP